MAWGVRIYLTLPGALEGEHSGQKLTYRIQDTLDELFFGHHVLEVFILRSLSVRLEINLKSGNLPQARKLGFPETIQRSRRCFVQKVLVI